MSSPHRTDRGPSRWILAVVLATVVLTIGSPLFGRGSLHPGDIVLQAAPWRSDAPPGFRPQNRLLTDVADAATPNRTELRRRILDGSYPLWNPYAAGGTPLGTQPQNGMLSPLQWPYVIFPPWFAPAIAKLLQMLIALGFTFLFLRRLSLGRPAALIGGLIFMNSAFLVVWTGFPHSDVAVLIPALFWAVDRAIARRTLRAALPVAIVIALMLFQGFPSVAAFAGLAVAAYAVIRIASRRSSAGESGFRTLARLTAAVALGAGIAAVQLLPFASSLDEFDRSYRKQTSSSILPLRSLATTAIPGAFGPLGDTGYTAMSGVEAQSFAGASTLILMLGALLPMSAARFPRRVRWFLWGGVAAMIALIYGGGPILGALQKLLPSIFGQNDISRMNSVVGFFVASLAAIGFETFTASARRPMRRMERIAWGACCVAAIIVAGLGLRWLIDFARDQGQLRHVVRQLWLPGIVAAATVLTLVVGSKIRPRGRHPLLWVAPVAFAVESIVFATAFLPTINRAEFYPVTSTHRFLETNLGHERMAAEGPTMWPGTQTFYRLRTVASHAFHPKPWRELLEAAGIATGYETQPQLSASQATATSPIFDRLGVRFWVTSSDLLPYGRAIRLSSGADTLTVGPGRPAEHPLSLRRVRAVIVTLAEPFTTTEPRVTLEAQLLGGDGTVLARGERRLSSGRSRGEFPVPLVEYVGQNANPTAIRIAVRSDGAAVRLVSNGGRPALRVVVAANDGLRLEFVDGALVYRRMSALPRIRWASRAVVGADPATRIRLISRGVDPATVVLDSSVPAAAGKPAAVGILEDSGDEIRVRVRAEGNGYLVVADSIQDGWQAHIDGRPAPILPAEHAIGAIPITAGDHMISLVYRPRAWRVGGMISIASILLLGLGAVVGARGPSRRAHGGLVPDGAIVLGGERHENAPVVSGHPTGEEEGVTR